MLRKSHIIQKTEFFEWLDRDDVSRIETAKSYNKTLKNKELCKIYVYYRDHSPSDLNSILGNCNTFVNRTDASIYPSDHAFLNGIASSKSTNFLTTKMIKRLREIEDRYGVKFNIPKYYIKLLKNENE